MEVDPILVDRDAVEVAAEQTRLAKRQQITASRSLIGPVAAPASRPAAPPAAPADDDTMILLAERGEREVLVDTTNLAFKRVREHLQRVSDEGLFSIMYHGSGSGALSVTPGTTYTEIHSSLRQAFHFSRQLIRAVRLVVQGWGAATTGPKGVRVTDADGRVIATVEWGTGAEDRHTGEWTDATAFKTDTVTHVEAKGVSADEVLVLHQIVLECRGYVAKPLA